jgi:hypothetical protein
VILRGAAVCTMTATGRQRKRRLQDAHRAGDRVPEPAAVGGALW